MTVNPYLNASDTAALVALVASVEPKVMIEIGCNTGHTAAAILEAVATLEKYIGIDVAPDHVPTLLCQYSEVPSHPGHHAADDPRFFLLLQDSRTLMHSDLEPCDAVFIDGDHSLKAVLHDSNLARALVRPGGIIIFHDYGNDAVEATQAIDQLRADGWAIKPIENSWLAFMRIGGSHADRPSNW
jgi:predicted O-methyltransferase YrrM